MCINMRVKVTVVSYKKNSSYFLKDHTHNTGIIKSII